jgi:cytidylate kinase
MHITITGNLGSGKSTYCRMLAEKYGFEIYSTGKVQRELARKMNMSTLELNQLMRTDEKYDRMIDGETTRISRENRDKNIIFDSRLAWHFAEKSFKVFVSVSLEAAAIRVMNDKRGEEERYSSLEEAKSLLAKRAETEKIRYKEIYNLEYMNFSNYNLVIDSTFCPPEKIADIIYNEALMYEQNPWDKTKILVSPKRLIIPGAGLRDIPDEPLEPEAGEICIMSGPAIKVKKAGDDFQVLDEFDRALEARRLNAYYVRIELAAD